MQIEKKKKKNLLQMHFYFQPEGGVLLQCGGKRHGVGRLDTTGQFQTTRRELKQKIVLKMPRQAFTV